MSRFRVRVAVELKDGLLDPQGKAVEGALPTLGWTGVSDVRVGKVVDLTVDAADEAEARGVVLDLAERFLSNPVIESSQIVEIAPLGAAEASA